MRKYMYGGVALLLALAIAGCGAGKGGSHNAASSGPGSSKSYAELRWGMTSFPGALDSTKTAYGATFAIESLAVQGLMEFEPDGKVKPGLASSAERPNPTTYVYHLKQVKFSDGKPLTSADVVFSLDSVMNGKESWAKGFWTDVASVSALNGATVVVKLKKPSAVFQDIVAFSGLVIEKAAAESSGEKALGTPGHMLIGTGPWKLESYQPEASVRLSRNPYWSGPQQPANKINIEIFKEEAEMALALRSGAIDGASEYISPKTFANIPDARQLSAPGEQVVGAVANTEQAPFNDMHVRRAMAYATDSQGMVDALYSGSGATVDAAFIPDSVLADLGSQDEVDKMLATLPTYEFNLAKAREELSKSAYPHGFSMPIEVISGSTVEVSAAQILASDLAKIGIKATVHEVSHAEETAWLTGKAKFVITDTGSLYPDPEAIMAYRFSPDQIYPNGDQNIANYRNAQLDELLTESAELLAPQKRLQVIGKLLRIESAEVPYWPLYSPKLTVMLANKYVFPGFSYWALSFTPWALNVKLAS